MQSWTAHHQSNNMKAWTDYPIIELGDVPHERAPVRECSVLSYDGDKRCLVLVDGVTKEIKAGYLYTKPGRSGEVPILTWRQLRLLEAPSNTRNQPDGQR
jgi:hypothetical protein